MRCLGTIITYAKHGKEIIQVGERSIYMMFHSETEIFQTWEAPRMMAQFDRLDKINSDPFQIMFFRTYKKPQEISFVDAQNRVLNF